VPIEELQQHWLTRIGGVEQVATDAAGLEGFVVQSSSLHPGRRPFPPGKLGADLVQGVGVEEVGALGAQCAHQGVDVGVGPPWDE
jgi:hypothetical protein